VSDMLATFSWCLTVTYRMCGFYGHIRGSWRNFGMFRKLFGCWIFDALFVLAGGHGHGESVTYEGLTLHKPARWHVVLAETSCAIMWWVPFSSSHFMASRDTKEQCACCLSFSFHGMFKCNFSSSTREVWVFLLEDYAHVSLQ
jgi:hypothetical protein